MKLADKILSALIRQLPNSSEIVIPNFYVGIYEMDLFRLMPSGYLVEYEVKISRSDYFSDFNKGKNRRLSKDKHLRIQQGERSNRFWFVVPEGLIKLDEVPSYAGLMEFKKWGSLNVIKNAPLIHKRKYDEKLYKGLAIKLSARDLFNKVKIRDMRFTISELRKDIKQLRNEANNNKQKAQA